jgi:hypothetical protein
MDKGELEETERALVEIDAAQHTPGEQAKAAREDFKIMCFWLFGTFIAIAIVVALVVLI